MIKKFYVTTPIYYVNDQPHIGHAYTTIAADVLARYWRNKLGKDKVFFLTGTDEHGDKVAAGAKAEGLEITEFVDKYASKFQETFKRLSIDYNKFIRTTEPEHNDSVQIFMNKLNQAGAVYQGVYEGLYCRDCEDFYREKDLADGQCPVHLKPPELVKEKNWFFRLEKYLRQVEELIASGELVIEPVNINKEVQGLLKQGLKDFSITRERVNWGLDFPVDSSLKIYVWVEALQNYISAIGYGRDDKEFNAWWPADIHLMAKDIIKFHCIYWPAMLLAAGEKLPRKIFAHGFFTVNGQKMSKTLKNAIDPNKLINKFGADATRYLLLSQFPFGQDGDIKESSFDEQYQASLANGVGNLVARVSKMIEQYLDGQINKSIKPSQEFNQHCELIEQEIEQLHLQGAIKTIQKALSSLDEVIEKAQPWQMAKEDKPQELKEILSQQAASILKLAQYIQLFMPETGQKIQDQFKQDKITKGEILFPRIESE
ncbi:MAG: methionine--tRNA ligase [bacterium]